MPAMIPVKFSTDILNIKRLTKINYPNSFLIKVKNITFLIGTH